jgi:alpha-ketoglutaric semialdehyde dehydrogenase
MTLTGSILVGASEKRSDNTFHAINPATGEAFGPAISEAGQADIDAAATLAAAAYPAFSGLAPALRAEFLEAVAEQILAIGDVLIETAMAETGLPRMRLEGERGRTVGQLRLFASHLRDGHWVDATIDPAMPERTPLPRGDLRRMNIALGPVAVFGASNFPLAFSVAGGDTASALAAGCPVIVKGHPAHPGTGELVARAIAAAVAAKGLPEGVFSYLPGTSHELGGGLVRHPAIKAVGFTGSRFGGLALVKIAQERAEPIPVYAELSAINPVILLPEALAARAEALGKAFAGSLTMGAGQFCTNPGLILALEGPDLASFIDAASVALGAVDPQVMLTPGIASAYAKGVSALDANPAASRVATGQEAGLNRCSPALFTVKAADFLADAALGHEVFGSSSVVVVAKDLAELQAVVAGLEGQLTATLHMDAGDHATAQALLPLLADRAGRVLANGWPTGVEVCHAMVHGGPFPATSDARTTSVGTLAMSRFLRPVCYQDIPDAILPPALQEANPLGLPRRVNGVWENA